MRKNAILFLFLFSLIPASAMATAQMGDILLYKGQTLSIFSNPLEMYFDATHPRPEGLFMSSCTANWRGYLATWEIKDGMLYLVGIKEGTCSNDAKTIPLDKVFPGKTGPIEATWFTGVLRAPQGELLEYVHMGYASVYEKEIFIHIEKGKVTKEEVVDNRKKDNKEPEDPNKEK